MYWVVSQPLKLLWMFFLFNISQTDMRDCSSASASPQRCKAFGLLVFILLWIITPSVCFCIEALIFGLLVCISFAYVGINSLFAYISCKYLSRCDFQLSFCGLAMPKILLFMKSNLSLFTNLFLLRRLAFQVLLWTWRDPLPPFDPFLHLKCQGGDEKVIQLSLKCRKMSVVTNGKTFSGRFLSNQKWNKSCPKPHSNPFSAWLRLATAQVPTSPHRSHRNWFSTGKTLSCENIRHGVL